MAKRAMLFPGQGAQYPGMGKEFCSAFPEAEEVYRRANEALGMDLMSICFEGSIEEVSRTDIGQPAILTTSIAIVNVLEKRFGLSPKDFSATSGLSLGDYSALVFSRVLNFDDALRLVAKRGRFMQEDSERNPSGMMSLIGASPEQARTLCEQYAENDVLVPANYLGPGQIAVSGSLEALDRAESHLKELGIRKGVRLRVAGAFHSPLMEEGGRKLATELRRVEFAKPVVPFASNVTGSFIDDPEEIRASLAQQVTAPVLWHDIMNNFIGKGVDTFFEPGPGKVLTGILKKINRNLFLHNLDDPDGIDTFVAGYRTGASFRAPGTHEVSFF